MNVKKGNPIGMKYALVKGERQEAQPDISGTCPCCDSPVIAKCGEIRMHHWAHRGMCDPWWEGETEWHREWKGFFPKEWQEVVHFAENGEKHIADVKTDQGYVVEFQHSYIKPEEINSREDFYKKIIWIIDGKRRLRDKGKFMDIWEQSHPTDRKVPARKIWEYFFDECAQKIVNDIMDPRMQLHMKDHNGPGKKKWLTEKFKKVPISTADRRALSFVTIKKQALESLDLLINTKDENTFKDAWDLYYKNIICIRNF